MNEQDRLREELEALRKEQRTLSQRKIDAQAKVDRKYEALLDFLFQKERNIIGELNRLKQRDTLLPDLIYTLKGEKQK